MEQTGCPPHGGETGDVHSLDPDRAYISIIESSHRPVVKSFRWKDGAIEKQHGAQISQGRAITVEADTASDLLRIIEGLNPRQAIALGVLSTANKWMQLASAAKAKPDEISRTLKWFSFKHGPGWCLFDIDTGDMPEGIVSQKGERDWWDLITELVPELRGREHLVVPSSSAGIVPPNGESIEATGLHVYVKLADAQYCPPLVQKVFDRLWGCGYGFVKIGKDGKRHLRGPIDTTVSSPERLIFEAAPKVHAPLVRNPPPKRLQHGQLLQEIAEADADRVSELKAAALAETQKEATAQNREYVNGRATKLSKELGISKTAARKRVAAQVRDRVLDDDDILETAPGQFERVGAMLDRAPGSFGMPCPIEGSDYGASTAYFYPEDDYSPVPRIISFAHGNKTFFRFERYRALWGLKWTDGGGETQAARAADEVQRSLMAHVKHAMTHEVMPALIKGRDNAPALLFCASVGVGKTSVQDSALPAPLAIGARIRICVPTIDLGEERLEKLKAVYGDRVGLWRGITQPDPDNEGQTMCLKADAALAAGALGADVSKLCGSKKTGFCQYHPDRGGPVCCGYKQQDLGRASIVIMAGSQALQRPLPTRCKKAASWRPEPPTSGGWRQLELLEDGSEVEKTLQPLSDRDFDLLLIDETDPSAWINGAEKQQTHFMSHVRATIADLPPSSARTSVLGFLDQFSLLAAECDQPYPDAGFLASVGSESFLIDVRKAAFALIPDPPEGAELRRLSVLEIRSIYAGLKRLRSTCLHIARMATVLLQAVQGRWTYCRHIEFQQEEAGGVRVSVQSRYEVHSTLKDVPKLLFDATARPELLEGIFPNLRQVCDLKASDGEGVRRYQLRDSAVSMTALRENPTWPARLLLLSAVLERSCGRTGMISTKDLMATIAECRGPDDQLEIGHLGAVKGLNRFEDCAALIICGRLAVTPNTAERMAAVLLERDIAPLGDQRFPKAKQYLEGRKTNTGWEVQTDTHPDPAVNAARASVTEDQLEQARGRGRNTRRTAEKPITEYLLTNVLTHYPVDATFTLGELYAATSWPTLMLASGAWVTSGEGTAIVGFLLQAAIRKAQRREPLYKTLIGNPAFESPTRAAKWRKDQLADNPELERFVARVDKQFATRAATLDILHTPFPIDDFSPVRAKVQGARYFAQLYVRTAPDQTPQDALREFLGPLAKEVEINDG